MDDDWTTTVVRFHGFANLSTTRGEYVTSPEFSCFGHQWVLRLYPGGNATSQQGYVAVSLINCSNTSIKIQHGYIVRNAEGREIVYRQSRTMELSARGLEEVIMPGAI